MEFETIGDRLKRARKEARFKSAKDFADQCNLSLSTYRHHENGTRSVSTKYVVQYSKLLKVHPAWLMTGEDCNDIEHIDALSPSDLRAAVKPYAMARVDEAVLSYLMEVAASLLEGLDVSQRADVIHSIINIYKTILDTEESEAVKLKFARSSVKLLHNKYKTDLKAAT